MLCWFILGLSSTRINLFLWSGKKIFGKAALHSNQWLISYESYEMCHFKCHHIWKKCFSFVLENSSYKDYIFGTVKSRIVWKDLPVLIILATQFNRPSRLKFQPLFYRPSNFMRLDHSVTKNFPLWNWHLFSPTSATRFPTKISLRPG